MRIKNWPIAERPREKLESHGVSSLSDSELLAIFIGTGIAGKNAVELSGELIEQFGGLRSLVTAERRVLCRMRGVFFASDCFAMDR